MSNDLSVSLRLDAPALRDESQSLGREWLVANGIGGYASGTVAGANTRRYHGQLVAALHPPLGRAVLLSHIEDSIELTARSARKGQTFALSTNIYPGAIYPRGYQALDSFSAWPVPTWVYAPIEGVRIEKRVWMAHGRNTTYVSYRVLEAPAGAVACLSVAPLLAWKDYHAEMHAYNAKLPVEWSAPVIAANGELPSEPGLLRVTLPPIIGVTDGPTRLDLRAMNDTGSAFAETQFEAQPNWYYRFQHPREQERGLDYEEDLYTPGTISVAIPVGRTFTLVASTESETPESPSASLDALIARQRDLCAGVQSADAPERLLALAADQFVIQAPDVRSTVIAGYPWFGDWGRDTMISLPGLCISTGRATIGREILLSFAAFVSMGMLPNRFPDAGAAPEYNTVDATLWYFAAIHAYVAATDDLDILREKLWSVLEEIVRYHQTGTRYNIMVSEADSLLYAGMPGAQLTWMDAKIGDWVVTPRTGKPVEINALWVNALRVMADFATRLGDAASVDRYVGIADKTAESFRSRFARPDGRGLYDVIDTPPANAPDASIRPNQLIAVSLPFAPIDAKSELAKQIVETVRAELLTDYGLRTLSPNDPAYTPCYSGNQVQRDSAYHQGTVWPWLLGPFVEAALKVNGDKAAAKAILQPLIDHVTDYCVGSLPEIADGDEPRRPNGCPAQAWSVAEALRLLVVLDS